MADDLAPSIAADAALPPAPKLAFAHCGFHCVDLPGMVAFYKRALGFTETDRGVARGHDIVFLSWDARDHHQVALVAGRPDLSGFNHINQLSFRVQSIREVQAVYRRVKDEAGVHDARGTNHGNAFAFYFRDPEGNRIEVFCDTPWYITQPCVEPLDLSKPADVILREAEAFCRAMPGFRPVGEWEAETRAKIAAGQAGH
jgi:catechol 2,3-dioxygenase-like lactoylglutathione lyase family enzyme